MQAISDEFLKYFEEVDDPRIDNANRRHELSDMLILTILAVICSADSWTEIEAFGQAKLDYLQLVDWTGRAVREGKKGAIPQDLKPIFQRLGLNQDQWLHTIQHFGRHYCLAAGAVDKLQNLAHKLGRCWLQGVGVSRQVSAVG